MPPDRQKERIAEYLRTLVASYLHQIRHFEEGLAALCRELEIQEIVWSDLMVHDHPTALTFRNPNHPIADWPTFSVLWQGQSCFLGNTLLFRFFEKIARRPNCYCSHQDLLDDVWGGPRADASIRNVVKRLRDRLVASGMSRLAEAIDGSVAGHYVLLLDRLK